MFTSDIGYWNIPVIITCQAVMNLAKWANEETRQWQKIDSFGRVSSIWSCFSMPKSKKCWLENYTALRGKFVAHNNKQTTWCWWWYCTLVVGGNFHWNQSTSFRQTGTCTQYSVALGLKFPVTSCCELWCCWWWWCCWWCWWWWWC